MPDVSLFSASEPLKPDNRVVIHYSVEVDGLSVYDESYDVDKLKEDLKTDPDRALRQWCLRILAAVYCRDKHGFSACLTRALIDGQGCACGHEDCVNLLESLQEKRAQPYQNQGNLG
jgi:hypothetical protein